MPSNNHRNVAASADPESNKAEIIAERFKTRLCKSYRKSGECPYFHRCMFAHGKDDIRTTEQNVAAGLVTENAVKAWQRARQKEAEKAEKAAARAAAKAAAEEEKRQKAEAAAAAAAAAAEEELREREAATTEDASPLPALVNEVMAAEHSASPVQAGCADPLVAAFTAPTDGAVKAPATRSASVSPKTTGSSTPVRRYRHDPYAEFSAWRPLDAVAEEPQRLAVAPLPTFAEFPSAASSPSPLGAPALPAPMDPRIVPHHKTAMLPGAAPVHTILMP